MSVKTILKKNGFKALHKKRLKISISQKKFKKLLTIFLKGTK